VTAENLFGQSVSLWCGLAFSVNGLFMELAHFAVYDVAALTGLAVSMWCVTQASRSDGSIWVIRAAIDFARAVISKYGYAAIVVPLLALLVSVRDGKRSDRAAVMFLSVAAVILIAYFGLIFRSLFPTSSATYLEHVREKSRSYRRASDCLRACALRAGECRRARGVAKTPAIIGRDVPARSVRVPGISSVDGEFRERAETCGGRLFIRYLLAGVALERLWNSRSRVSAVSVLATLVIWGRLQCYVQDYSWSDTRTLAHYLARYI
jgi:hypothetical protein